MVSIHVGANFESVIRRNRRGDVATLKRNFDVQFYFFREISTRLALVSRIATLARIGESLSLSVTGRGTRRV